MQFLNPIYLIGLSAAAIPIVLHLLSRRNVEDIPFAPLRFLIPTQEKQNRRLNLRRLLLLLLRVAIIAFVVMAMARPTLTGGLASLVSAGEGVSAVILVDASASMHSQVAGGTVFDLARSEAVKIAGELGSGDEVAVALFTDGFQPLFEEFVRDPNLVLAELEETTPSYRSTDYFNALEGALDFLGRSSRDHREIYLVSDFQMVEADSLRLSRFRARLEKSPPTNIFLRRVQSDPFVNRSVADVERPATLLRSGQTARVAATVRQDGADTLPLPLFLQVAGNAVGETELELAGGGSRRHVFPITLPQAGDLGGSIRLRPDRYPPDDERFFVLSVGEQVPALVLRGVVGTEGERDPLLFLLAALDPGGRGDGNFDLVVENASAFDVNRLPSTHVVVAVDLRNLGAARLSSITDFLEGGGTMLLFAGDPRVRAYLNERLLPAWTNLRLGEFRGEADVHERLVVADRDHPVFAGFEDEEIQTLEEARLRNFFRLPDDIGRPLIRFADRGAAVVEVETGKGRLILCGFHTAAAAGTLPYSPMFLPLVQRLTGYLATAGWGRFGRHYEVGAQLVVEAPDAASAEAQVQVRRPDGTVAVATIDASTTPARLEWDGADRPGVYSFEVDGETWSQCAVNVSTSESIRQFERAEDFGDRFTSGTARFRALEGDSTVDSLRDARQGKGIHQLFLMLAGILLVVESLVSRRVGGDSPEPA